MPRYLRSSTGPAGPGRRDRYGLVLLLLVASFLLSAFLPQQPVRLLPLSLCLAALVVALRSPDRAGTGSHRLAWVMVGGSVLIAAADVTWRHRVTYGLVSVWLALIVALTIVVVIRRILAHRVVSVQTILGAVSAYLLIGFMFAAVFSAVAHLGSEPFFADGRAARSSTIQYFSFVTMTTLGYGDLVPAGEPGRSLAVLEALVGQVFLVTLVARLVSILGNERGVPRDSPPG